MFEYIVFAFLGGLILNVMPCVLPVLTMKVFHTIESAGRAHEDQGTARLHGIFYTLGIVVTFLLFAAVVIAIRASGERIGWGMQFQHPPFVAALVALIYVFGLNALGVFEVHVSLAGAPRLSGHLGDALSGAFAAIMSTPCTAPFLGTAAAVALAQDTAAWETALLFAVIGFGLAFPYLLIAFVPRIGRWLPKPGAWMESFKKLMGFTLMGAAVWLFGVLQAQVSASSSTWFLAFLLVLAVVLWGVHHWGGVQHATGRRLIVHAAALGLVVASAQRMVFFEPAQAAAAPAVADGRAVVNGHINWTPFSAERIAKARASGQPVFVDFTADWCAACKTNERVFLETDTVRQAFVDTRVLPMKADMTNENREIERWLAELGRSGIPAYVIYMPDGSYDLLPVVITAELVAQRLRRAAKAPARQAS